jgi:hypothetical protein
LDKGVFDKERLLRYNQTYTKLDNEIALRIIEEELSKGGISNKN